MSLSDQVFVVVLILSLGAVFVLVFVLFESLRAYRKLTERYSDRHGSAEDVIKEIAV